jgi:glycosyltransferase involved in cell wall biosynthesis
MRKKNLKWFIELLTDIKQPLTLDIYGPIEDKNYWQESLAIIQRLPSNIKVNYAGSISHNEVVSTLFKYHYFILPTLGENFGHVFIEALSAGCPIIISDRTPWLNLYEKSVGWDLPLEEPDKWLEVIRECINADQVKYNNISSKARSFAVEWLSDKKVKEATYEVLSYSVCAT